MSNKKSKYEKLDGMKTDEIMNQYSVYKNINQRNTDLQFVNYYNTSLTKEHHIDYSRFGYIKKMWGKKSAEGIVTVDISIKDKVISLFTSNIINPNNEIKEIYDAFIDACRPSLHFDESNHLVKNIRKIRSAYLIYLKNGDSTVYQDENVDIIDNNSISNSNNINTTIDIYNNNNNNTNENNDMDIDNNNNDSNENNDMDIDHNIDDDDKTSVSNFGMYK
jgi:hypothetical protein